MKEFFLQYIKCSMFLAVMALFLFVNGLVNAEEFEQKRLMVLVIQMKTVLIVALYMNG